MAPNMKDSTQETVYNNRTTTSCITNFNILKALVHFSIQLSADRSGDMGIQDLLKPSKTKVKSEDSLPLIWVPDDNDESKWKGKIDDAQNLKNKNSNTNKLSPMIPNSRKNSLDSECLCTMMTTGKKVSKDSGNKADKIPLTKRWLRPTFKRAKSKEENRTILNGEKKTEAATVGSISDVIEQMSLQQHLALKALNLAAPASSSAFQSQRHEFVQLSGHVGYLTPAGPQTIYKKIAGARNEVLVYKALTEDPAKNIAPAFFGEVEKDNETCIEIQDLLHGFNDPCMMDIKMGTRTFLESEADNLKPREDLYEKMMKVDPSAILSVEHENKNMTKLRYMNLRDLTSSSRSLGFRIEALKMNDSCCVTQLKKLQEQEIVTTLGSFVQNRASTKTQITERLRTIRETFENSNYFKCHEVIGSSILIVYDDNHIGAWIIDFAKTINLPESVHINHRQEWKNGNHEDGYLLGLDNLIKAFEQIETN